MSLEIIIKEDTNSNNYREALSLKNIFENSINLNNKNGEILIFCNNTYSGYRSKKIDFIITGYFEDYYCKTKTKAIYNSPKGVHEEHKFGLRYVKIDNFFFTIEIKNDQLIELELNKYSKIVNRKDNSYETTNQSQTKSLTDYLNNSLSTSPFICHFYWYKNIDTSSSILDLFKNKGVKTDKYNYLPNTFNFSYILMLACLQKTPYFPVSKTGDIKDHCIFKSLQTYQFNFSKISSLFDINSIQNQTIFHELGHLIVYCLSNKYELTSLGKIKKIEFNPIGQISFIQPKSNLYYKNSDYNNSNSEEIKKNAKNTKRTLCWIINQISGCIFESFYLKESFEKCFSSKINCSGSKDYSNLTNLKYEVFVPKDKSTDDIENQIFDEKIKTVRIIYTFLLKKHNIFEKTILFLNSFKEKNFHLLSSGFFVFTDDKIDNFLKEIENNIITENFVHDFFDLLEIEKDNFKC